MILELPLKYFIRHIPKGKKKATLSIAQESFYTEISEVSEDQAPLAGNLTIPRIAGKNLNHWTNTDPKQDISIDYRVARGKNGKLYLMADALQGAFQTVAFNGFIDAPALCRIPAFGCSAQQSNVVPNDPSNGEILSNERDMGLDRLHWLMERMVVVDGRLWMACSSPGYQLAYYQENKVPDAWIVATSDPMDRDNYTVWHRNHEAIQYHPSIIFRDPYVPANSGYKKLLLKDISDERAGRVKESGCLVENLAGVFETDTVSRRLKSLIQPVIWPDPEVIGQMTEQEMGLMFRLRRIHEQWLDVKPKDIAAACVKLAKVVHGIKPMGNKDGLDEILSVQDVLTNTANYPLLEERLNRKGVFISTETTTLKI